MSEMHSYQYQASWSYFEVIDNAKINVYIPYVVFLLYTTKNCVIVIIL